MFDALTNERKHLNQTLLILCVAGDSQTIFGLAQLMMCIMMLHNFLQFLDQKSLHIVRQTGCPYVNYTCIALPNCETLFLMALRTEVVQYICFSE